MKHKAHSWLLPKGASKERLEELQSTIPGLPSDYIEMLGDGNGGEVGLQVSPFNLCLDSVEEALSYWRSKICPMKGVFVFGGNGGGELLAFDMRKPGDSPVISFDPIDPEGSVEFVAASFKELVSLVEREDV